MNRCRQSSILIIFVLVGRNLAFYRHQRSPCLRRQAHPRLAERRRAHCLRRQAARPPSAAAAERTQPQPAGLRGRRLHPVRRLRARFGESRHRPSLRRAFAAAAPLRQAVRHRLLIEDAQLFSGQVPRVQLRAWVHAFGGHRRLGPHAGGTPALPGRCCSAAIQSPGKNLHSASCSAPQRFSYAGIGRRCCGGNATV